MRPVEWTLMPGTAATVGTIGALAALVAGLSVVGAASVHAQRLSAATDAAALAAADAASGAVTGVPCERAAQLAATASAEVVSCEVEGLIATVRLSSAFGPFPAQAAARAGPAPEPRDDG